MEISVAGVFRALERFGLGVLTGVQTGLVVPVDASVMRIEAGEIVQDLSSSTISILDEGSSRSPLVDESCVSSVSVDIIKGDFDDSISVDNFKRLTSLGGGENDVPSIGVTSTFFFGAFNTDVFEVVPLLISNDSLLSIDGDTTLLLSLDDEEQNKDLTTSSCSELITASALLFLGAFFEQPFGERKSSYQ